MYLTNVPTILQHMPEIPGAYFLPFMPSHLERIDDAHMYFASKMGKNSVIEHINLQAEQGPAITAMLRGEPVAIFGCVLMWNGVGELWSMFSEKARRYPFAMTNSGITFCDIVEILFHLHRLQITVKTADTRAIKWANVLGFKAEGVMKSYSADKEDFTMMRRT